MGITKLLEVDSLWTFLRVLVDNIIKLFYFLYTCLASLVDLCQYLFRQMAGLETVYVNNKPIEGDLVSHFFIGVLTGEYPILQTLFWSVMILGIIFLFLTTLIAIIKSEANPWTSENKKGEKKVANGKGKIFSTAGRALVRMAIIPVTCIFACYFGGIVLNAIEGATTVSQTSTQMSQIASGDAFQKNANGTYYHYDIFGISLESNQVSFSGIAFKTVMYNANRVRSTSWFYDQVIYAEDTNEDSTGNFGVFDQANNIEDCAELIDEVFANNAILKNDYAGKKLDFEKSEMKKIANETADFFTDYNDRITQFSKFNVGLVSYYYDLWKFNIIIGFAYMIIMFSMFYKIVFGLVRRLIYLLALFLTAPAFCGLSPLDGERSYGGWKSAFVKEFLSVFGTVAAMNLFLIFLPYFEQISFFQASNRAVELINKLVGMLFTLVGVSMVSEFSKLIGEFIGGGDIVTSGDNALKGAKELGNKSVGAIGKVAGGAAMVAGGLAKAGGKGIKAMAQTSRDNKLKKEAATKKKLQDEVNQQKKDVRSQRDKEKQKLLDNQKQKNTALDNIYEGQRQNIKDEANRDVQGFKDEAEQQKETARNEYIDKYMELDKQRHPEKYQTEESIEKQRQFYGKRYDGLKGTQKFNEKVNKETAQKVAERRREEIQERQEFDKVTQQRRIEREEKQKQEIKAFEAETKRRVDATATEQIAQLKVIKDKQKERNKKLKEDQEKREKRELRRANMTNLAGRVYKASETSLSGVKNMMSGLAGGIGVGGKKK